MHLIEVIPITRALTPETLSYFHSRHLEPGTIVSVPIRKKDVRALVVSSTDAKRSRAQIRTSKYSLKKVSSVKSDSLLSSGFLGAAEETSSFFLTPLSKVLFEITPAEAFESREHRSADLKVRSVSQRHIEASFEKRMDAYKDEIHEALRDGFSSMILCPTSEDAKKVHKFLKDNSGTNILFHGKLPKKKRQKAWADMHSSEKVTIVGTSGILAVNRRNLGLIVIERESSGAYRTFSKPSFDITFLAGSLGRNLGARTVWGDILLRTESIGDKDVIQNAESKKNLDIADIRNEDGEFQIISDELKHKLENYLNAGKKVFVYASRRGSGTVLCMDCGQGVVCNKCGAPVVLYEKNFSCHACGQKRSAKEKCIKCDSWNLKEYGIGSEKVENLLKETFKDKVIVRIDSDSAPTERKLQETLNAWEEKGDILVGTAKALPYITAVDLSVVSSLQSLISFPGFNMEENALRTLLLLEEKSNGLFIQTHDKDHSLLEILRKRNWKQFHKEEFDKRKRFSYPPFKILVKISKETEEGEIPPDMQKLADKLSDHSPILFLSEPGRIRKKQVAHILLKISPEIWAESKLRDLLSPLAQTFKVEVNPVGLF